MTDQPRQNGGTVAEAAEGRGWTPSRSPVHRVAPEKAAAASGLVVADENVGFLRALLRRRFVRLTIGIGVFSLGAVVYDTTVNYGRWTERQDAPKATKHKGLAPVAKTPDDVRSDQR